MWLYRRMLRISWKEHKTNADVLHKMKTKRSLLNTIKKRKCQYFGHIIRRDGIQRLLMEGRINGRRGRGRPRTMWTDNIKEWTKMSYNGLYQSGTRSRTMEIHDSRPVDYRWHIMMMMMTEEWRQADTRSIIPPS